MKIYGDQEQEESDLAKTSKKFNLGTGNDEGGGDTETEPTQEEKIPEPPNTLQLSDLRKLDSVEDAGFYLFVYEQKDEQDKVIATYYICRTEMEGEYTYTYYSKTNQASKVNEVTTSFNAISGLTKSKAEEGWLAFDNSLPILAPPNLLSSQFKAHKDDVTTNNNVLSGQINTNYLARAEETMLRELAIENIKGRKIQAALDSQTQTNTDIANQNGINANLPIVLENLSEAEIAAELEIVKKQRKADKEEYAKLKQIQAELNKVNLEKWEERRQRPADQNIGTTAVDNVYTNVEKPAVDFSGLEYLFEKTLQENGWMDGKLLLIIGLTPAGIILDVVDLMAAIVAGDIAGIITSAAGFIPGGDFLKAYKKTETALKNTPNISSGSVDNIVSSADGKIVNAGLTNNTPINNAITNTGTGVQPQITNTTTQVTNQITPTLQAGKRKYQVLTQSEMQALLDKDVSQLTDAEKTLVEAYKKQVQGKKATETVEIPVANHNQIKGIQSISNRIKNEKADKNIQALIKLHEANSDELKKLSSLVSALSKTKDPTIEAKLLAVLENAAKTEKPPLPPLPTQAELTALTTVPKPVKPAPPTPAPVVKNKDYDYLDTQAKIDKSGLKNTEVASADERLAAEQKITDFENQAQIEGKNIKGKNLGYLEGKVTLKDKDAFANDAVQTSVSKEEFKGSEESTKLKDAKFFDVKIVDKGNNIHDKPSDDAWPRYTDSEYLILTRFVFKMQEEFPTFKFKKGEIYKDIEGKLKIASTNPYCASCQDVIKQFNQSFPEIKLILVDNIKKLE